MGSPVSRTPGAARGAFAVLHAASQTIPVFPIAYMDCVYFHTSHTLHIARKCLHIHTYTVHSHTLHTYYTFMEYIKTSVI